MALILVLALPSLSHPAQVQVAPNGSLRVDGEPFFPFGFFGVSGDACSEVSSIGDSFFKFFLCKYV